MGKISPSCGKGRRGVLYRGHISSDCGFISEKAIARDAFRASIGYILPDYLQDEMRAIYSNEIVCVDHSQDVKIELLGNDLVRIVPGSDERSKISATIITRLYPRFGWTSGLFQGRHRQLVTVATECRIQARLWNTVCRSRPVPELYAKSRELILRPQTEVEVWLSFSEIKRRSDFSYLAFSYATQKPRVRMNVPDGFGSAVEFTHRLKTKKLETGETILPGLLLPNQCIIARWWEEMRKTEWEEPFRRAKRQ